MNRGWWTLGRLQGAPIRVHFTLLLGALFWSGFRFTPALWLAFAALILVHELGHALLVLRYRLGLSEIAIHGAGGYCRHERSGSRYEEAVVAWGGVLAQLVVFGAAQLALLLLGPPRSLPALQVLYVFTNANLWLIFINLLPIGQLDGAKAWPLVGMLLAKLRTRGAATQAPRRRSVQDELRDIERIGGPDDATDRVVRDLISRTTQSKDDR